jgi:hypothetical protein
VTTVQLDDAQRRRTQLSDEWRYAQLATLIETWCFRASHQREHLSRWTDDVVERLLGELRPRARRTTRWSTRS